MALTNPDYPTDYPAEGGISQWVPRRADDARL